MFLRKRSQFRPGIQFIAADWAAVQRRSHNGRVALVARIEFVFANRNSNARLEIAAAISGVDTEETQAGPRAAAPVAVAVVVEPSLGDSSWQGRSKSGLRFDCLVAKNSGLPASSVLSPARFGGRLGYR